MEWLLERGLVDESWCLVHATHMTDSEVRSLARHRRRGRPLPDDGGQSRRRLLPAASSFWRPAAGFGIGSDSHVSVSPVEELRWLEYGQRLLLGRRNVAASATEPNSGARLVRAALAGGSQALGQATGSIAPGQPADLVELDAGHPLLRGGAGDELLDRLVFAGNRPLVRQCHGGRPAGRAGRPARPGRVCDRRVLRRHRPVFGSPAGESHMNPIEHPERADPTIPRYQQLKSHIVASIQAGRLRPRDRVPRSTIWCAASVSPG